LASKETKLFAYMDIRIYNSGMTPTQFFKCLSEDIRLNMMLLIRDQSELCVCELVDTLNESQPKVSRHLAQLRICNLLIDRRVDQWVYYALHPELPTWALAVLEQVNGADKTRLDVLLRQLRALENRPGLCVSD